jgi:putative ABC transport system permease protein
MFYELSRLSISNLLRARARLVMTAGGVLVGTTAVILLIALTIGLQNAAEAGIGQSGSLTEIQVWPNWGPPEAGQEYVEPPQLTVENVNAMWRIPGVAAVVPIVNLSGGGELKAGDYSGYSQIAGIDPRLLPYLGLTVTRGTLSLGPGEVLVGARAGDYFSDPGAGGDEWEPVAVDLLATEDLRMTVYNWNSGNGETRRVKLKPVGEITGGSFDYMVLMPLDEVLKLNEWTNGQPIDLETFKFDQVTVRAVDREATNGISEAIRDLGFSTGGLGDFLNQINQFFSTMRLMLGGVGAVALLVAAFGVANTMTMAILERTKEIGLMKAIGANDRDILTIFLVEAGLVGLAGGAAGVAFSLVLQNLVNQAIANLPQGDPNSGGGFMFLPFDPNQIGGNLFVIPPELMVFALALATLVGIGAGLYPSMRAARLQPVIALKTE